jgi:quaternary ammonium compound-resistance protein SugE
MAWIYLFVAGLSEIAWAFGMKYSDGFTKPVPSIITVLLIIFSFILFAKAMKTIPIGTAYAVFTGIGAAGTVVVEMIFAHHIGMTKLFFLALLIAGIIGLKLTSGSENEMAKEKE